MKFTLRCVLTVFVALMQIENIYSQCNPAPPVVFNNASFEGPTGAGITPAPWNNCLAGQTPDTQPGNWGVTLPATNGASYIGLVHQVSAGWQEGAAEPLSAPLVAGVGYHFTMDLANSSSTGGGIMPGCAECQIWGGYSACDKAELLWSSGNITPYDVWQSNSVNFIPSQNFTWIMIQVNALGCSDEPYILVDNISPISPSTVSANFHIDHNVSCNGLSDGQATVHAIGDHPPFSYAWSVTPTPADTVLHNLPAGTYHVTVTDANTCFDTATVVITEPAPIILTPTVVPVSCFGFSTGSAYMSYAGGTEPMSFVWSNGPHTQNDSALFAGTYGLVVTDSLGCSVTSSVIITQPQALAVTGVVSNVHCYAGNDGMIVGSTTNGTAPYHYEWSGVPHQFTDTAFQLTAGNYIVTVTDSMACSVTAGFAVTQPPTPPTVTLTAIPVQCYGQSTGSVNSIPQGGTPPYTYSWNTTPVQTTQNITNLAAGTYTVILSDLYSCTYTYSAAVGQPAAPLALSIAESDVFCYGQNTGGAIVTASGGTAGYTYGWNTAPVQTTANANSLIAGNYTVVVTDAHSCTANSATTVNQPAAPLTLTETHVNVLCYGANTGSATVTAAGGTSGYTYNWSTAPAQTTATAITLTAATYTVTVTDANSCIAAITSTISQPASPVQVTGILTAPLCFGQANAAATANATGGTPGYSYSWNTVPVQNTQSISNIPPGTYTVTATDNNGCIDTSSIQVSAPPTQLTTTTSHIDVLCFGDSTGSVSVVASGSFGNYSYHWDSSPAQNTATASQIIAGNYHVTVTDVVGCTATATETVSQPLAPLAVSVTKTDVLCYGQATGTATATATGGTVTYNYAWSTTPQQNVPAITLLIAGNYIVTVTDANACLQTATITINQPAQPLGATSNITNVTCNGSTDGNIILTPTGGTVNYSYRWSPGSATTQNATGIGAGTYDMTVTDANNCTFAVVNMVVTEPSAMTLTTNVTNVSCPGHNDGKIEAVVNGGSSPYTFSWNNGTNIPVDSNLAGGTYFLHVTDDHNCTITSGNLLVTELPGIDLTSNITNVLCYPLTNGAVDVTATSSFQPVKFLWNTGATTPNISNLATGTYKLTVEDAHSCEVQSAFTVNNDSIFSIDATPDVSNINLGKSADLMVVPIGSNLSTIEWTPAYGLSCTDCANPQSSPITDVTYWVTGTDIHGCIATDSVRVIVTPTYIVFIPNVFTPNGDGNNDYFEVFGNKEAWKQFEVDVFNRWGEMVYQSNDMNFKWDGNYKGQALNPAEYVYMVKVIYMDNYSEKLFKGTVLLAR